MKIDEAVSKLIDRLRAVEWEEADDCGRMPDDPTHKCVFVDMRPDDFRALLREAAAALEAAREDAAEAKQNGYELGLLEAAREDGWQPIETAPNEAWFLVHSDRGWIGLARRSDPDYAPDEGWFEDEHTEFLDPAWLTHWSPLPAPPAIDQARGKAGQEVGDG